MTTSKPSYDQFRIPVRFLCREHRGKSNYLAARGAAPDCWRCQLRAVLWRRVERSSDYHRDPEHPFNLILILPASSAARRALRESGADRPVVKPACGNCIHLIRQPNDRLRTFANVEDRPLGGGARAGVCRKIGLWCSLASFRCAGDEYEPDDGMVQNAQKGGN